MSNQEQVKSRRAARHIAAIAAVAMLIITGSSHAAATFIYANSASSQSAQRLYTIDATTGAVMKTCLLQKGNGRGIVVVSNLVYYTVADSNNVFKADINTCADLGVAFSVSGASGLSTMAFDGTNFWIGDYSGTNKAYYYSTTGTLLKTVALANCAGHCDGLEFFNGKLISNRGDSIPPYDIYDTSGTLVTPAFITAAFSATGIAFDGNDFFVSDIFGQKLQVYNGSTGAFVKTVTITGLAPGANEIEDLSVDYSQRPDTQPPPMVDPCCPPWNSGRLEDMLFYVGSGGIGAPFTLQFQPSSSFEGQIQAYINYLNTLNPAINSIIIAFRLNDAGTGSVPTGGPMVGLAHFVAWSAGGNGSPSNGPVNFFTLLDEPMQVNRWYRVHTGIFLNDQEQFFPKGCADNHVDIRIQVQHGPGAADPVLQIFQPDGRIIEKALSLATRNRD